MKKWFTTIVILFILSVTAFLFLFFYDKWPERIKNKFCKNINTTEAIGDNQSPYKYHNVTLSSWSACLKQMKPSADIIIIGDSIIARSDFTKYYPSVSICNLGLSGDTIAGITDRIDMIDSVKCHRIFLMGGINCLNDYRMLECVDDYTILINSIKSIKPEATIYIFSVLPISLEWSKKKKLSNQSIEAFNDELKKVALERDVTYIDLYTLFLKDGYINNKYSDDGLHPNDEGYKVWAEVISDYIE